MCAAFSDVFPNAVMLTCYKHIQDNISRHLTSNVDGKEDCPLRVKRLIEHDYFKLCKITIRSEFDARVKQFERDYSEYFTERFLKSLLEKTEHKIVNPHILDESLPPLFFNNEVKYITTFLLTWGQCSRLEFCFK